jgi:hypothetical protein
VVAVVPAADWSVVVVPVAAAVPMVLGSMFAKAFFWHACMNSSCVTNEAFCG